MLSPENWTITQPYGETMFSLSHRNIYPDGVHYGIDLTGDRSVPAFQGGKVSFIGWNGSYGYSIVIDGNNGYKYLYAHLSAIYVNKGEQVKRYDKIIGRMGSTGTSTGIHLHFGKYKQILWNKTYYNPYQDLLIHDSMINEYDNCIIRARSSGRFAYVKDGQKQLITKESSGLALITYLDRLKNSDSITEMIKNVDDEDWYKLPEVSDGTWF